MSMADTIPFFSNVFHLWDFFAFELNSILLNLIGVSAPPLPQMWSVHWWLLDTETDLERYNDGAIAMLTLCRKKKSQDRIGLKAFNCWSCWTQLRNSDENDISSFQVKQSKWVLFALLLAPIQQRWFQTSLSICVMFVVVWLSFPTQDKICWKWWSTKFCIHNYVQSVISQNLKPINTTQYQGPKIK